MTKRPSPFEPGNPYYRPPETSDPYLSSDAPGPPQPPVYGGSQRGVGGERGEGVRAISVPWTVRDVALGTLVPVGFYAVSFLLRRVMDAPITPTTPTPDQDIRWLTGLLVILFQLALLLPVWWLGLRKYGVGVQTLGLRGYAVLPGCGLTFVMLLVGYMFTGAWGFFLQQYGMRAQPNPLPIFGQGVPGLLLALLAGGLVAPFTEEIFFRGFVFGALRTRYGAFAGIIVSALIFAVAHLQPLAFPALFALGALLAWLYVLTGSLWPGIILHATINTVALIALYLAQFVVPGGRL